MAESLGKPVSQVASLVTGGLKGGFNLLKQGGMKGVAAITPRRPQATTRQEKRKSYHDQSQDEEHDDGQPHLTDEEILQKIPPEFYQPGQNAELFLFDKLLPVEFTEQLLEKELNEKEKQLDLIIEQLSSMVMGNYNAFVQGMTQIHELAVDLQTSGIVCKNGRRYLKNSKEELIQRVIVILAKSRKREMYQDVVDGMQHIRHIMSVEKQIKQRLQEGDYPKAIELCLECRTAINTYKHFTCVQELGNQLQESYNEIQEKLDKSLQETCSSFNAVAYERILVGYRLMGQSAKVLDKVERFFSEAINTNTKNLLYSQVLMIGDLDKIEGLKKMKFRELAEAALTEQHFLSCLNGILENMTDTMYGCHSMIAWHTHYQSESNPEDENRKFLIDVKEGLTTFKKTLWDDMQNKVAIILSASTLPNFKIDDFLKVLDVVYKFVGIGEEFGQNEAIKLRGSIKTQSQAYFENMHRSMFEDLATMLENEMWQKCPVQKNFNILDMKEFRAFRHPPNFYGTSSTLGANYSSVFANWPDDGNPFHPQYKKSTVSEDELRSDAVSDDEDEEGLNVDEVVEQDGSTKAQSTPTFSSGPLLTTSTINVARFLGKYLSMMKILQPISYEIFVGIRQILEYYIYTINVFFGNSHEEQSPTVHSRVRSCLAILNKQFAPPPPDPVSTLNPLNPLAMMNTTPEAVRAKQQQQKSKYKTAELNPMVKDQMINPADLYGLGIRAVGIESLAFLTDAFVRIKPHLQFQLPKAREKALIEFYDMVVDPIPLVIRHLYKAFASRLFNWEEFLNGVGNCKWDTRTLGIEYNSYVDALLKELTTFGRKLVRVQKMYGFQDKVKDMIWEEVIKYSMEMLVEGYARAKKCTNEGRAQMSLDVKSFAAGLEKLVTIRPIPYVGYVEEFIKAYYQPETLFLTWCKDHMNYSLKQWLSIVNVGVGQQMKARAKQELITALEALDASRQHIQEFNVALNLVEKDRVSIPPSPLKVPSSTTTTTTASSPSTTSSVVPKPATPSGSGATATKTATPATTTTTAATQVKK